MSSTTIHYPQALEDGKPYFLKQEDEAHFLSTFNRAMIMSTGDGPMPTEVHIHLGQRTKPRRTAEGVVFDEGGWLEHTIVIKYEGGRQMVIGAIQRTVGAHSEFHS